MIKVTTLEREDLSGDTATMNSSKVGDELVARMVLTEMDAVDRKLSLPEIELATLA